MKKEEMLRLRLNGYTYQYIADEAKVSRQRVQQILSPPRAIREFVVHKYKGKCERCGIFVGKSGHVHHRDSHNGDNFDDIDNLELLCTSCHRNAHLGGKSRKQITERNQNIWGYWQKGYRQISIANMFKMKLSAVSMVILRERIRLLGAKEK